VYEGVHEALQRCINRTTKRMSRIWLVVRPGFLSRSSPTGISKTKGHCKNGSSAEAMRGTCCRGHIPFLCAIQNACRLKILQDGIWGFYWGKPHENQPAIGFTSLMGEVNSGVDVGLCAHGYFLVAAACFGRQSGSLLCGAKLNVVVGGCSCSMTAGGPLAMISSCL
jgi:hypothetical protein